MANLLKNPKKTPPLEIGEAFAKKQLSQQQMESLFVGVSEFFEVLSEPSRLRILYEKSVTEVIEACGSSQANVSRHLSALHQAKILNRRKVGTTVFYAIEDQATLEICQNICARIAEELFSEKS
jgi:DNA-binding transcriptional ArsR family regulator